MKLQAVSLFTAADIHDLRGSSRLKEVLGLVARDEDAVMPSAVVLGGDLVGGGKPVRMGGRAEDWVPVYSLASIRGEIRDVLGEGTQAYFTYGSHDCNEINGNRDFLHGPADCGAFYIYGISFAQMRYTDPSQLGTGHSPDTDADSGTAAEAVEQFKKWIDTLEDRKPLFVISHLPLHANRGDNRAASMWVPALNRAAKDRDVFVFYAHNHTAERKDIPAVDGKPRTEGKREYERGFYLKLPGSVMAVQGGEKEERVDMEIEFTYLNAGYILNGAGTLLTLSSPREDGSYSEITIKRYTSDPEDRDFGATGIKSPYTMPLR